MSKQILTVDSTQITQFLECPTLWQLSSLENLTRFDGAPKVAMNKGSYGHKLLEIYYKATCIPNLSKHAIDYALDWEPKADHCVCGHLESDHTGLPVENGADSDGCLIFCRSDDCGCSGFQAAQFPLEPQEIQQIKDRFFLYAVTWQTKTGDIIPLDADSVEVGFSEVIYEDDDYLFILEGKIDVVGTIQRQKVILDHKWQDRARRLYKQSIQFKNYCLVTDVDTMVINYIRMAEKVDQDTFVRDISSFSRLDLRSWKTELINIFHRIILFQKMLTMNCADESMQTHNWASCGGKFGYQCEFTQLCEQQFIPVQELMKQTQYKQKPIWRPW